MTLAKLHGGALAAAANSAHLVEGGTDSVKSGVALSSFGAGWPLQAVTAGLPHGRPWRAEVVYPGGLLALPCFAGWQLRTSAVF